MRKLHCETAELNFPFDPGSRIKEWFMRDNSHSAEEYRDWIINILHQCERDELIALIVPYGESGILKSMLELYGKTHP